MLNVVDKILTVVAVIHDNSFSRVTFIGYGMDGWVLAGAGNSFSLPLYLDQPSGPLASLSIVYQRFFLKE